MNVLKSIANFQGEILQTVFKQKALLNALKTFSSRAKLEHIGILDQCKADSNYEFGQTFFHKIFAYRGIILHPWTVHIYERNRDVTNSVKQQDDTGNIKKCVPKLETYYQVLVDSRDSAQLASHSSEAVTLSRSDNKPMLFTIPGIDYVSHEDIIPYTSCEEVPVQHELFRKFYQLHKKRPIFQPTEMFNAWQKENHFCLEVVNVHKETTEHIRVTAIPFFLGTEESPNRIQPLEYWWRYSVRIENLSGFNAQLRETYWRTISNGTVNTRRGFGIMGKEPLLSRDQPAFQISIKPFSLTTPSGQMWGTFRLEREDGEQFDVRIPAFSLDSRTLPDSSVSSV